MDGSSQWGSGQKSALYGKELPEAMLTEESHVSSSFDQVIEQRELNQPVVIGQNRNGKILFAEGEGVRSSSSKGAGDTLEIQHLAATSSKLSIEILHQMANKKVIKGQKEQAMEEAKYTQQINAVKSDLIALEHEEMLLQKGTQL